MDRAERVAKMQQDWKTNERWKGIERPYLAEEVAKMQGSVVLEYTLGQIGAKRLWKLMHSEDFINALGALTGNQAVEQIQAGLKAIYLSGWQVAADANHAGIMYPDQSLYPADSVPGVVRKINNALMRADQIDHMNENSDVHWLAPIVADAEAGFGGALNAFELMRAMKEAGAAGVHFEDQLASAKKCGHMGGKVLVPTNEFVRKLVAARLASDVMGVPTVLLARTDAFSATLITSDVDEYDHQFIDYDAPRTIEGFYRLKGSLDRAIARGLAYAPYCDVIWCETATPDLEDARKFAEAIHDKYPGKLLAYNCSPSFNWKRHLDEATIAKFQRELGAMGYKFQFVTLAGFHTLNTSMFELALGYRDNGMAAYSKLQEREFQLEKDHGFRAVKHQSFVGAGYFDEIQNIITGGEASTRALEGSTEEEQFH